MAKPDIVKIEELLKDSLTPSASDDGKVLTWDDAQGKFLLKTKPAGGGIVASAIRLKSNATDLSPNFTVSTIPDTV